jgi:predicted MFS family arabinose efflux permease
MRWLAGFIFHKVAFGLLSVLLPLYITQSVSGGSLTIWGIIAASATFLAIPFSFLWGYLCDATHHYKFFILLSFTAVTILLYLFSLATSLLLLGVLYMSIVVFQVAYEPPKNVLIAETYSHVEWRHAFALYEAWTELGWVAGLLLGFLLVLIGLEVAMLLLVSVFLSLLSFLASAVSVTDPALIFERGLVTMERSVSLVHRGATLLSVERPNSGILDELRQENALALCVGLVFFSLATSMFFTPLPIFLAKNLSLQTSIVFMLFLLNSTGCLVGYLIVERMADMLDANRSIKHIALLRSFLVLLPVSVALLPFLGAIALSMIVLVAMGFVYAFYSVAVIAVSMEVISHGKAGLFTALLGTGTAVGCFMGPLVAENLGFSYTFTVSAVCFFLSFVAFKKFA